MIKLKTVRDKVVYWITYSLKKLYHCFKMIRMPVCFVGFFIFLAGAGGAGDLGLPLWPDTLVPFILAFVCINLCIIWQDDHRIPEEILSTVIEDDDSDIGGIAYEGETLRDFMEDVCLSPLSTSLEEVNKYLEECGIKKIEITKGAEK